MDCTLKGYAFRFLRLFAGLATAAVGIACTVNANLGLSPWEVLSQGISIKTNIMLGTLTQIIGIFVLMLVIVFKEKIGLGTLCDIAIVGKCINIYLQYNLIPQPNSFTGKFILLVSGLLVWSFGVYLYMSAGLGAGPRDSLMVALTKKFNVKISFAKNSIELIVLIVGYLLGGTVGLGTVISVFLVGYVIRGIFFVFRFDVKTIQNDSIMDTLNNIKSQLVKLQEV